MIEWTWIITALSIIGVIANIYKKRWCFGVWIITNSVWMIVDYIHGIYAQSFLFAVYLVLAVWGYIKWGDKK